MLDRKRCSCWLLFPALVLVAGSVALAAPRAVRAPDQPQPLRYNPRSLDGPLVSATSPLDGRVWSAWAYRDGAEYDIAIAVRNHDGSWSEPAFLGRRDGADQTQPALALDAFGNVYVAFADGATGGIAVSALPSGAAAWLDPGPVTEPGERGFMPALRIVGHRLIVAYRSRHGVEIRDFGLLGPPVLGPRGIQDGPEPFGNNGGGGDDGRTNPGGGGGGGNGG